MLAALLLRENFAWPLDNGMSLRDGQPLLGRSKTWRGLLASLLVTAAVASLLGLNVGLGLLFATLAMAGDLAASFVKRRLGLRSGASAVGLDQLPEALLPLSILQTPLGLDLRSLAATAALFLVLDLIGTRLIAAYKS